MIHARKDYNHIQDETGHIGEDEPVFILRAKDMLSPDTVEWWADKLESIPGHDTEAVEVARRHAQTMRAWQNLHGKKLPDMPSSF